MGFGLVLLPIVLFVVGMVCQFGFGFVDGGGGDFFFVYTFGARGYCVLGFPLSCPNGASTRNYLDVQVCSKPRKSETI